jgi:hypothetical protein
VDFAARFTMYANPSYPTIVMHCDLRQQIGHLVTQYDAIIDLQQIQFSRQTDYSGIAEAFAF